MVIFGCAPPQVLFSSSFSKKVFFLEFFSILIRLFRFNRLTKAIFITLIDCYHPTVLGTTLVSREFVNRHVAIIFVMRKNEKEERVCAIVSEAIYSKWMQ